VSYNITNVLDGDPTTAWRVSGDGIGVEIVLDLGGTFNVTRVGLIPGYAKFDADSNVDRFFENRRITSVVWDFADGSSVTQAFADVSEMQSTAVNVTTTWVRLRITGTTEDGGRDFAAISDVRIDRAPVPTTSPTPTFAPIPTFPSAPMIAAGTSHSCALLGDGTVSCWGSNGTGQLGDGTQTDRLTPVQVVGLTDAVAIAAGSNHSCALHGDGTVSCWGS
jgi:hypothetical protein